MYPSSSVNVCEGTVFTAAFCGFDSSFMFGCKSENDSLWRAASRCSWSSSESLSGDNTSAWDLFSELAWIIGSVWDSILNSVCGLFVGCDIISDWDWIFESNWFSGSALDSVPGVVNTTSGISVECDNISASI